MGSIGFFTNADLRGGCLERSHKNNPPSLLPLLTSSSSLCFLPCSTPARCPATGVRHRHMMAATALCDASASRRELLEAALQQADDELSDACRCFRAWVGRQREVLDVLRALPADTACSSLVAQAEKLKTGTELEDLLCAISVFPSTLDRTLMELSSVISANSGQLQPAIVRDGREPVLVQREKVTNDADSPQWESAWLKVEAGALMLFSSADSARPSTSVLLSGYFYEHAGGGERTNGQRDVRLQPVDAATSSKTPCTPAATVALQALDAAGDRHAHGKENASMPASRHPAAVPLEAASPSLAAAADAEVMASADCSPGESIGLKQSSPAQADSLVSRWAGALSLKLRAQESAHLQPQTPASAAEADPFWGFGRSKEDGDAKPARGAKHQAPQPTKWWGGLKRWDDFRVLAKLGRGGRYETAVPVGGQAGGSSEICLRFDGEKFQRYHDIFLVHCSRAPLPSMPSSAVSPRSRVPELSSVVDVQVESIEAMGGWELICAMKTLRATHTACSVARGRLSALYRQEGALCVESLLLQVSNLVLHVQWALAAADVDDESACAEHPQNSLQVWLVDEMTHNLHLGLMFGWTLDAGAPPELVQSVLPPHDSRLQNVADSRVSSVDAKAKNARGAHDGVRGGAMQGLSTAVGAVGGAALSHTHTALHGVTQSVTRSLSFVNATASATGTAIGLGCAAEVRNRQNLLHDAYRTLKMWTETALLAGRRIGSSAPANDRPGDRKLADDTATTDLFRRLCREDEEMRRIYGEKCPFETLRPSAEPIDVEPRDGCSSRFAADCIREELGRRKEFVHRQRVLMEELTRVSSVLAAVPKDKRAALMHDMLREVHGSLPTGAYIPLCHSSHRHEVVVALAYDEAVCLSTFERAPFAVAVEVVSLPHSLQNTYSVVRSVELLHYWLHLRLQRGCSNSHTDQDTCNDAAATACDSCAWKRRPSVITWCSHTVVSNHASLRAGALSLPCLPPTVTGSPPGEPESTDTEEDVVILTPSDAASAHTHLDENKSAVVDEGVGLGWWWRPRVGAGAASDQSGDMSVLDKVFGESWESRSERRRRLSVYGSHEGWRLRPVIVKSGDDLRQEQFAMQLIAQIRDMWREAGLPLRVTTYDILALSPSTGIMEMVADTVSLAALRKRHTPFVSLEAFYVAAFGDGSDGRLQEAQTQFVRSMAAYSIICYILKVKDRHDGNILLQRDGSIIHIDWGYMLGRSMNAVLEVERAPFKLTRDHVAVMGGESSANFLSYISLCVQGLQVLRERGGILVEMVRAMSAGSPLTCVSELEVAELQERLALKYSEKEVVERFILLQGQALSSWSTVAYDLLQTVLGV